MTSHHAHGSRGRLPSRWHEEGFLIHYCCGWPRHLRRFNTQVSVGWAANAGLEGGWRDSQQLCSAEQEKYKYMSWNGPRKVLRFWGSGSFLCDVRGHFHIFHFAFKWELLYVLPRKSGKQLHGAMNWENNCSWAEAGEANASDACARLDHALGHVWRILFRASFTFDGFGKMGSWSLWRLGFASGHHAVQRRNRRANVWRATPAPATFFVLVPKVD